MSTSLGIEMLAVVLLISQSLVVVRVGDYDQLLEPADVGEALDSEDNRGTEE